MRLQLASYMLFSIAKATYSLSLCTILRSRSLLGWTFRYAISILYTIIIIACILNSAFIDFAIAILLFAICYLPIALVLPPGSMSESDQYPLLARL